MDWKWYFTLYWAILFWLCVLSGIIGAWIVKDLIQQLICSGLVCILLFLALGTTLVAYSDYKFVQNGYYEHD